MKQITVNQLEATEQLERARATLGKALGLTQDITNSGLDVEQVSASLARSVKDIFVLQSNGLSAPQSVERINSAMGHLRRTLILLQDVADQDPALERTTSTVARTLAILYPIAKMLVQISAANSPVPIPLTRHASSGAAARVSRVSKVTKDERRSSDRRVIEVDIGIHSDTNFFTGFSQDISSGGLFVATYDILEIGTRLNINFSIPGGPILSLNGVVRWIREYNETTPDIEPGMGVCFEKLSRGDVLAINKFIAENPPIFYEDS